MELMHKLRWVIIVIVLLVSLILVGWGLSSIAKSIFRSRPSSTAQTADQVETVTLKGVKSARYIVEGPVVASSEQRSYVIEVTDKAVVMKVYSDYGQKVVKEKSYPNNASAFDALISSLEAANATARYSGTDEADDMADTGVCSEGKRYIIELDETIRRWTTSCDRKQGTAAGKMTTMRTLFTMQVPDFNTILKEAKFSR